MKKAESYTEKYKYYPSIPVDVVNKIIKDAQIEAYNEAIEDAFEKVTKRPIEHIQNHILKLKK